MREESKGGEHSGGEGPGRGRTISAVWDRRQSEFLVLGMGFLLTVLFGLRIFTVVGIDRPPMWFFWSLAVSLGLAVVVWKLRAATPWAAALGGAFTLDLLTRQYFEIPWWKSAFPEMMLLFMLTFAATRFGRKRKLAMGMVDSRERRGRQASQVMANLGVAALLASKDADIAFAAGLAVLAEATADTVSSELGQVFGGRTIMITTGKVVPAGTDGGISLVGTALGFLSAGLIAGLAAALGAVTPRMGIMVFLCGSCGLLFDSVLGATVERWGWFGNDLVNFFSTVFAAALASKLMALVTPPVMFW